MRPQKRECAQGAGRSPSKITAPLIITRLYLKKSSNIQFSRIFKLYCINMLASRVFNNQYGKNYWAGVPELRDTQALLEEHIVT